MKPAKHNGICPRCGNPEKISKTWIEMLKTSAGESKLTISQIVCTNKECQEKFEKDREEEIRKRDEAKKKREEASGKKPQPAKKLTLK